MTNLNNFLNEPFFDASIDFFKGLNIPVNSIESQPFLPKDFLKNTYNQNSPAHSLIDKIYFLGIVDDKVLQGFENNHTLEKANAISADYEGIAIISVELKNRDNGLLPTRSQLAEMTRAINREFLYTPVTVLFKYNEFLALANAERTSYLVKYKEGEKVGKVSILRDISIQKPHSGHLQIINELKVPKSVDSFKSLDKHWNDVFSVSLLNKRFYKELSNWYFWAIKEVRFPGEPTQLDASDKGKPLSDLLNEQRATNVIRLLTRLLFVWFLKEKKLIPEELFDKDFLDKNLLKNLNIDHSGLFQNNQKSIYYKAILQNLFFASLNCPIKPTDKNDTRERGFRKDDNFGQHRGADFMMRYRAEFKNPELFLDLVNKYVPFLNGGLFDCLDQKEDKIYIDGFSDNLSGGNLLIVPDYLFFGLDETIDLSAEYGLKDKQTKESAVKGLIRLLKSYKFTIDENTPVEQDVALDPELLGKVFENLLASYNPETKTTARKQTGSFYTPREIVNYMVDESLKEYLKTKMLDGGMGYLPIGNQQAELFGNEERKGQLKIETEINPYTNNEEALSEHLNALFSYSADQPFTDDSEIKKLISALDACKILDPACGSGAFPMGILQKMVHILQKLDPENRHWKDFQRHKAEQEMGIALETLKDDERKERLEDIEKSFDENVNSPDYARKLFLIENCIYGVDIQPIATQISRLRFFISLVVDQKPSAEQDNFGIRPLPNLEAKFVTANTLIGIEKPKMESLFDKPEVKVLEDKLKEVRHRLFSAKTSKTKRNLKLRDKELRTEIASHLSGDIGNENASLLANWDPYDQNISAPFFDPEWMFGLDSGFDVILGNPPYVQMQNNGGELSNIYGKFGYKTFAKTGDIYSLFYERGWQLLKNKSILCYITSNKWMRAGYGESSRKFFAENTNPLILIDFAGQKIFDAATVDRNILLFEKDKNRQQTKACTVKEKVLNNLSDYVIQNAILTGFSSESWVILSDIEQSIKRKIEAVGVPLKDWDINIYRGILTGYNEAFIISGEKKEEILNNCKTSEERAKTSELIRPLLRGRDIKRYSYDFADIYLLFIPWHFPLHKDPTIKGASKKAEQEFENQYAAVYNHLLQYKTELSNRNKAETGIRYEWYALQRWGANYWEDFSKQKIVYIEIMTDNPNEGFEFPSFSFDKENSIVLNTAYFMTGQDRDLKHILGILNSKVGRVLVKNYVVQLQQRQYRMLGQYVANFPIPKAINSEISLVTDEILNNFSNTEEFRELIKNLNTLIYKLYQFNESEISFIELQ